ncbi:peptidylprolyl isomerase [Paludisphaera rhizosphaerae]|uniref:peptidylprolyl isomerase n=1 Tax=Paludisphaera rhizosphaerae TaxID=2711216 RepID=UPI0013EB7162|nr:peptidylprolyl isomerase [Paludisphaera rhizosphaerae]
MKRLTLAAALAGLAFAGCAQSRSAKLPDEPDAQPVGLVPVPSIHETINRGSNPAVARTTLPDPSNPNWSGAPLVSPRAATGLAPSVASSDGRTGPMPTRDASAVATRLSEPPRELPNAPTAAEPADAGPSLPPIIEAAPAAEPAPAEPPPEMTLSPAAEATPAPEPVGDPLLGPNPQLMPDMKPAPAASPVGEPLQPSASTLEPAPEPDPEPAPAPGSGSPSASLSPAPRGDSAVQQVSTASAPVVADVVDTNWKQATRAAARVGDEVITLGELVTAVKDTVRKQGGDVGRLSRQEKNLVAQHILNALIERSLMVQEAKHQLKTKDKQLVKIQEAADTVWRETELPPLLRQYSVENEQQLAHKLEEERRSLGAMRQNFRQEFLAYAFMEQKLGKVEVALPEMLKYYEAHRDDKANQRPPAIVWREILIDKRRHASPEEARRKADVLLDRLRRGEDFAALAAAESEAPAKFKANGGLMETAPGSYIVAAVNQAIETLPLNAVGDVVEGPESLHILRVQERRAGGPATFAELQDSIRAALRAEKGEGRRKVLVEGLRKKTLITTIFDGTESDPNLVRR